MEIGDHSPFATSPNYQPTAPPSCQPLASNLMSSSSNQNNSGPSPISAHPQIFPNNNPSELVGVQAAPSSSSAHFFPGGVPNQFQVQSSSSPGSLGMNSQSQHFFATANPHGAPGRQLSGPPGPAYHPAPQSNGMQFPGSNLNAPGGGSMHLMQIKEEMKHEMQSGGGPPPSVLQASLAGVQGQGRGPMMMGHRGDHHHLPNHSTFPHQFQHQTRSFVYIFTSELAKNASEAVKQGLCRNIIEYHKKHHQVKSRQEDQQQAPPLYHPPPMSMSGPETPPFGIAAGRMTGNGDPLCRSSGPPCSPVTPTVTQSPSSGFGSKQTTPKTVATVAPQPATLSGGRARTSSTGGSAISLDSTAVTTGGGNSRKRPIGSPASVPPPPPKTPLTPLGNGPASVQPVSSVNFAFEKGQGNAVTASNGGCSLPTAPLGTSPAAPTISTTMLTTPISSFSTVSSVTGPGFGLSPVSVSGNGYIDRSNLPITEALERSDPGDDPLQKMAKLANQSMPFTTEPPMKQIKMEMQPGGPMAAALSKEKVIAPDDELTPQQREHRETQLKRIELMKAQFCLSDSAMQPIQAPQQHQPQHPGTMGMHFNQPPAYHQGPGGMPGGPMMMRVPRPGMVMTGPGECMPGQVMMMAGGAQMQVMGPGPPHPGMVHMENTPQHHVQAQMEWQKLRQEYEMEQYQKQQTQDFVPLTSPGQPPSMQPVPNVVPGPRPGSAGKGSRQRQPRSVPGMPVPGSRMSIQQPGKPMVMVAPSNVMPPSGPRGGHHRMPMHMHRGQRMVIPRMMQEQQMAYVSPEEQMMMHQHQQFMMGPGGQNPRARMMVQMQQGSNVQMMASGQPHPDMLMHMEGGGYCGGPGDPNFSSEMGYMGDINRPPYMQDFGGPQPNMVDPATGMMMGPNGEFFGPTGSEFDGNGAPGMKMQMINSSGFDMDVQGASGPVQGQGPPGQPTVNNTYVNATMSIQQLNIQNVGPPIHQLQPGSTPPLGPGASGPHGQFQPRGGPPGQPGHDVRQDLGGPDFGMPPFSFQSMPEPLTNLDSKVPSQKLQYFPTTKPLGSSSGVGAQAPTSVAGSLGMDASSVTTPCSMGYQPSGNQVEGLVSGSNDFDRSPSAQYPPNMGQPPAPMSQAQYGSFENFQQQLYASNSNSGSKQ